MQFASLMLPFVMAIGLSAAPPQNNGLASSKVLSATGVVKVVSVSSLTLKSGDDEMTFRVDASTRVLTKRKTARNDLVYRYRESDGRRIRSTLSDFVKRGDDVTVRYRQSASVMTAVEVRSAQK